MIKTDKKEHEKSSTSDEAKFQKSDVKEETIENKLKATEEKLLRTMAEM